jgi:hypothetical protein
VKRRKPVDPETIRKQTVKAIFTLRKSSVIAGQQDWITPEQSPILSDHIFRIEAIFMRALPPAPEPESESRACLPF